MHNLEEHLFKIHESGKDALRKLIKKSINGTTILDVGCGTGHITLELLQEGYEVTAIDISKEFVDFLTKIICSTNYNCEVMLLDITDSNNFRKLGKDKFDTVLCLDVLEHVENDIIALRNLNYVTKNEGRLVIVVPALKFLYGRRDREIGHFRRYSKKELIEKLNLTGFKVVDLRYWNFIGMFPFIFFEKILRRRTYEGIRYSRKSTFSKYTNSLLLRWFSWFENNIKFPVGLSIIAICEKSSSSA